MRGTSVPNCRNWERAEQSKWRIFVFSEVRKGRDCCLLRRRCRQVFKDKPCSERHWHRRVCACSASSVLSLSTFYMLMVHDVLVGYSLEFFLLFLFLHFPSLLIIFVSFVCSFVCVCETDEKRRAEIYSHHGLSVVPCLARHFSAGKVAIPTWNELWRRPSFILSKAKDQQQLCFSRSIHLLKQSQSFTLNCTYSRDRMYT